MFCYINIYFGTGYGLVLNVLDQVAHIDLIFGFIQFLAKVVSEHGIYKFLFHYNNLLPEHVSLDYTIKKENPFKRKQNIIVII